MNNHPLGLELGDVILGYDGRPWLDIWKIFLKPNYPSVVIWSIYPPSPWKEFPIICKSIAGML